MKKREVYVITNGEKYIRQDYNNKYKAHRDISLANEYNSLRGARNVLENSLPIAYRKNFYVARVENGQVIKCEPTIYKKKSFEREEKEDYEYDLSYSSITHWLQLIDNMDTLFSEAIKRSGEIATELSKIDAEKIDLEHYIEFKNQNACNGYKVYRRLQNVLRRRRQLVNEQKIISIINKTAYESENVIKMITAIKGLDNQKYKPRVLVELFRENKIDE